MGVASSYPYNSRRELVDGVLALLRALDVAIFAAALAEEVAFRPLPVRATPTASMGDEKRPPTTT